MTVYYYIKLFNSYFDYDKDGKLNEKERQKAMKALEEGFENKFIWGVE